MGKINEFMGWLRSKGFDHTGQNVNDCFDKINELIDEKMKSKIPKHNYHIRLNPHAVALVDEGCPQETIDALCRMSELALEGFKDKSSLTSKAASGEDGFVNPQTSPSLHTLSNTDG
jgi:hypothetical protein